MVRIVFVLTFFKLLKNEISFGKRFSFPFSAKCFDRNFKCLFENLFLNIMKFRRFKTN